MPNVAGIVLTGGRRPPRFFDQIIKGISKDHQSMPVFIVDSDTFQTVTVANKVSGFARSYLCAWICTCAGAGAWVRE